MGKDEADDPTPALEGRAMPSPFPGMNPYLEQESVWHDFHERFLPAAATDLVAQVRPRYIVLIDENRYLHDIPAAERQLIGRLDLSITASRESKGRAAATALDVLDAPAEVRLPEVDVERVSYLKVLDRASRALVTVVELLSPTNKRPGDHRAQYLGKRSLLRQSRTHLVEIDLLRGGKPLPVEGRPACTYSVLVSRADDRPRADFWPIGLRDVLPNIPIPLRPEDHPAQLNLQALLNRVFDDSGSEDYLYQDEPDPPLMGDDAAWARSLVPQGRARS